jgi:hypothetical protein
MANYRHDPQGIIVEGREGVGVARDDFPVADAHPCFNDDGYWRWH